MALGRRVERKYPIPLSMHQLWMVSLSAPVDRRWYASRTTLYPFHRIADGRAHRWLARQWGITSRDQVLEALSGLAGSGYRAQVADRFGISPLAWDLALYVDVVRNGFAAGHLDEPAAWQLLRTVVEPAAGSYGSWKEYADDYLLGRLVWMGTLRGTPDENFPAPQAVSDAHIRGLLDPANAASPWNMAPWQAIHQPDRPRPRER